MSIAIIEYRSSIKSNFIFPPYIPSANFPRYRGYRFITIFGSFHNSPSMFLNPKTHFPTFRSGKNQCSFFPFLLLLFFKRATNSKWNRNGPESDCESRIEVTRGNKKESEKGRRPLFVFSARSAPSASCLSTEGRTN